MDPKFPSNDMSTFNWNLISTKNNIALEDA